MTTFSNSIDHYLLVFRRLFFVDTGKRASCSYLRNRASVSLGWIDATSEAGAGDIRFRAWGERADDLIEQLLQLLQTLPVGQPPEIKRFSQCHGRHQSRGRRFIVRHCRAACQRHGDSFQPPELPPKKHPRDFVSYAWAMTLQKTLESARKLLIGSVRGSGNMVGISCATALCCAQAI
jgi:hypothetical protein